MRWEARPIAMWSLAWAITGASLAIADIFSTPRKGPLWVAIVGGAIGWALAGGATVDAFSRSASPRSMSRPAATTLWSIAFFISGWFGLIAAMVLAQITKTAFAVVLGQRIALLIGWSAGSAIGGFAAGSFAMRARRAS